MTVTCDGISSDGLSHDYFSSATYGMASGDDYPYSITAIGARTQGYTTETLDVSVSSFNLMVKYEDTYIPDIAGV